MDFKCFFFLFIFFTVSSIYSPEIMCSPFVEKYLVDTTHQYHTNLCHWKQHSYHRQTSIAATMRHPFLTTLAVTIYLATCSHCLSSEVHFRRCANRRLSHNIVLSGTARSAAHCTSFCVSTLDCDGFSVEKTKPKRYSCELHSFNSAIATCEDVTLIAENGVDSYITGLYRCNWGSKVSFI